MATHTSILAWKIPWAEEPGRSQSIGSQSQTRRITLGLSSENCVDYGMCSARTQHPVGVWEGVVCSFFACLTVSQSRPCWQGPSREYSLLCCETIQNPQSGSF